MQLEQKRQSTRPLSWIGLVTLLVSANLSHGVAADECDAYNVQLQATYRDQIAIPCTDEEYSTIEALIHALVQTDVIVGLNGIPVPDFFLGFETYGSGVVKLGSFDESHFMTTQMEQALPHLKLKDNIEDMYYEYTFNETNDSALVVSSRNFTESSSDLQKVIQDNNLEEEGTPIEIDRNEEIFEAIQPFEDSLRNGPDSSSDENNSIKEDNEDRNLLRNKSVNVADVNDEGRCEVDWCGYFFSRPCESIPQAPSEEASSRYQAEIKRFQDRVATVLENKLRKWARDTDCMCLGNSWELKAIVKKLG